MTPIETEKLNVADGAPDESIRFVADMDDVRFNVADSKHFEADVIYPGLVAYKYPYPRGVEYEYLPKEVIDAALASAEGNPLVVNHCEMVAKPDVPVHGRVEKMWFDEKTGTYKQRGTVETEEAENKARAGWKPSVAYRVAEFGPGGTRAGISFDRTIKKMHLYHTALVPRPRYEDTTFRLNSADQTDENTPMLKVIQSSLDAAKNLVKRAFSVSPESTINIDGQAVKLNAAFDIVSSAKKKAAETAGISLDANTVFEHPTLGPVSYSLLSACVSAQRASERFNGMEKEKDETDEAFAKRKENAKEEMEKKNAAVIEAFSHPEGVTHSEAVQRAHEGKTDPVSHNVNDTAAHTTEAGKSANEEANKISKGLGQVPGADSVRTNEADQTRKDFLFLTSPAARAEQGVVFEPAPTESPLEIGSKMYGSSK